MDLKQFAINLSFAIVGLALIMGVVGLSIYLSHWYSLVNNPLYIEVLGASWKNVGVAAATCVTLGVVSVVLSFSFPWTTYILSFAGIMQIPSIVLVGIIINYTTKSDEMIQHFIDIYPNITDIESYNSVWGCKGVSKYDSSTCDLAGTDPTKDLCCDSRIANLIENRTTLCYPWFLGYTLTWIISMVLLIPMSIFLCDRGQKE